MAHELRTTIKVRIPINLKNATEAVERTKALNVAVEALEIALAECKASIDAPAPSIVQTRAPVNGGEAEVVADNLGMV